MRLHGLLATLAVSTLAHADPASHARADKLFEDGRRYLTAKEYALACTAFEQSQEAEPAIGTELNIALCYEDWGKIMSAYRAYQEAERLAMIKLDDRAKGARKKVDELGLHVPRLTFDLPADADPNAVILLDGKELDHGRLAEEMMLDPGPHAVEVRVPNKPPTRTPFDLKVGERRRLMLAASALAIKPTVVIAPVVVGRNTHRLHVGIGVASGGVVLAGVAATVALIARKDYDDAIARCPDLVCESRADYDATRNARSRANYMTIVGSGGLLLVAVGVYLMATTRTEGHAVTIAPSVGTGGVGVVLGGRL